MATPLLAVKDKMLQAAPGNKGIILYAFESNSCAHLLSSYFRKKLRMHCRAQRLSTLILLFLSTQLFIDCLCLFFFFFFSFPCFVFKWKNHLFFIYMKSSFKSIGLPAALKSLQMLCVVRIPSAKRCWCGCTTYGKPTSCVPSKFVMTLLRSLGLGFAYSVPLRGARNWESPTIFAAFGCQKGMYFLRNNL